MTSHGLVLVLCILVFLVAKEHVLSHGQVEARPIVVQEAGLKHEGTITTIKTPYGDTIDCVDIYKQPALRHPLIKHIQMEPSSLPEGIKKDKSTPTVAQDPIGCPEGTIPIRRSTSSNTKRRTSLHSFLEAQANKGTDEPINKDHEYAVAGTRFDASTYHGFHATVSVWNPKVEGQEMSVSQIWFMANGSGGFNDDLNTIEAGWTVNPTQYQDYLTRFFIFWTGNDYGSGSCQDLLCPGFVQTNPDFVIGGPLNYSSYGFNSIELNITVFKDKDSGNYWLYVNNDVQVGYWPKSIFTSLASGATNVKFGGEIYNSKISGHHTTTEMGSGHFPREGYRKSSYFESIAVIDYTDTPKLPENLEFIVSNPKCYDLQLQHDAPTGFGTAFYYGGPGYSPTCQL